MKDKIFKLTLDNLGKYEIKFLPNVNDPLSPVIELKTHISFNNKWSYMNFSHAIINGVPKIFIFSEKLNPRQEFKFGNNPYSFDDGRYLNVKTINKQNFVYYDELEYKSSDKYIYPTKSEEDKKKILSMYDIFGDLTLEKVREHYMFKFAENDTRINNMKLKDFYKKEYPDFEKRYNIYLRNEKILNVKKI